MVEIHETVERPLFHSEADFQFALAWLIQRENPEALVRLEYKPAYVDRRGYLDLWVEIGASTTAIELKYFTRRLAHRLGEESYDLVDQSAVDIGRYNFLKDVSRVESVVAARPGTVGYAIALTNNEGYWKVPSTTSVTIDAAFRIHDGVEIRGELAWSPEAGAGTTKGIEKPISLSGIFNLRWRDYSRVTEGLGGVFRYLLVSIARD